MGTGREREEDEVVYRVIRLTWNSDSFLTKNTNFIFYLYIVFIHLIMKFLQ